MSFRSEYTNRPLVCVFTASRSEYGLLAETVRLLRNYDQVRVGLIVSGAHLTPSYGNTVEAVRNDDAPILEELDNLLSDDSRSATATSMGLCGIQIASVFKKHQPRGLLVLGDRYELVPVVAAAVMMSIPVFHVSGGDTTTGAIDNKYRHAVSMMADYHFPGTRESATRIERMGIAPNTVYVVGEPGIDNFRLTEKMSRQELSNYLEIDELARWAMMTYHPETMVDIERDLDIVSTIIKSFETAKDWILVATYANADPGGSQINRLLDEAASSDPEHIKVVPSLGQRRYLSMLRECVFVIGNSSSGVVEAPSVGTPSMDIGERQEGRYMARSVVHVDRDVDRVREVLNWWLSDAPATGEPDSHYGDGFASEKISTKIVQLICENE